MHNASERTSTPDPAVREDIGNDDQTLVEEPHSSGAQRPFSRGAPPPPTPPPRTPENLQAVHAIGFHPKEAQRAAWVLGGVLGLAGGVNKRRALDGPVGGHAGVGGSGSGGGGKNDKEAKPEVEPEVSPEVSPEMKPKEKARLVAGSVENGVSTVKGDVGGGGGRGGGGGEWGPEESPRLFSESVGGSYMSDYKGEEEMTSPDEGDKEDEPRFLVARPVVVSSSRGASEIKQGGQELQVQEPRIVSGAVRGSVVRKGESVQEKNPEEKPSGEQGNERRFLPARAEKVDAWQASTHPAMNRVREEEDRDEQEMESLWDFASKSFQHDLREVRRRQDFGSRAHAARLFAYQPAAPSRSIARTRRTIRCAEVTSTPIQLSRSQYNR